MSASNVIPFPSARQNHKQPIPFPAGPYVRPVLVMPSHDDKRDEQPLFDEFAIWSRRFGRSLVAAMRWLKM